MASWKGESTEPALISVEIHHGTKSWGDPTRMLTLLCKKYLTMLAVYQELPVLVLQTESR